MTLKGVYYNNVWDAQKFPFLSQLLFTAESNGTNYVTYNQTAILDANNRVDPVLVAEQGLPFYTATFAVASLTTNMAVTATFVHMLLWCYNDISSGWAFINRKNLRNLLRPTTWKWRFWQSNEEEHKARMLADPNTDPHYRRKCNFSLAAMRVVVGLVIPFLGEHKTRLSKAQGFYLAILNLSTYWY